MKPWFAILSVIVLGFSSVPARSEPSAKVLLDAYAKTNATGQGQFNIALEMVEAGLGWANSELTQTRKTVALYCLPKDLALQGPQLIDMLRRTVAKIPTLAELPFGVVLLKSLQDTFPCRPQSN